MRVSIHNIEGRGFVQNLLFLQLTLLCSLENNANPILKRCRSFSMNRRYHIVLVRSKVTMGITGEVPRMLGFRSGDTSCAASQTVLFYQPIQIILKKAYRLSTILNCVHIVLI